MTVVERIRFYIEQLCQDLGVDSSRIYNPVTNAWYFTDGRSTLEVFLTTQKSGPGEARTFLRCMAPLCVIPADINIQYKLFRTVLLINGAYPGFKISADEERGLLCVVSERNISGLEYTEMVEMFENLGFWANKLDDFLKEEGSYK